MSGGLRHLVLLAVLIPATVALGYRVDRYLAPLPPEPDEPAATPTAPPNAVAVPQPVQYTPPPFGQFREILERPLFNQSRRPVEAEVAAPPPVVRRTLEASLQGVLFSATGRVALLSARGSTDVVRVAEQETFQGWRLERITPDSATFTRGEETVTLRLTYKATE